MYKLYRVKKDGTKELVGYYENQVEAGCAIEEDVRKFDDEAAYELERD